MGCGGSSISFFSWRQTYSLCLYNIYLVAVSKCLVCLFAACLFSPTLQKRERIRERERESESVRERRTTSAFGHFSVTTDCVSLVR